ncbi:MAG: glycosyltransferase family 2 protein [Prevotella sp.]
MKKTPYKVSVAVRMYNAEQHISRCVTSLMLQSYQNIEYVFLDDCSTDETINIVESISRKFSDRAHHVRIVRHNRNLGRAISQNDVLRECSGDFVYVVDADDYIEHDTISTLVKEQILSGADIVSAGFYMNDYEIDPRFTNPLHKDREEMLISMLSQVWHHELCGRLIRRSLIENNHISTPPMLSCVKIGLWCR